MTDPAPQFTMREWRAHMAAPVRLICLLGAGLIVAIAAPFGTGEVLGLAGRVVYWLCVVFVTYSIGYVANVIAMRWVAPLAGSVAAAGLLTGVGAFAFIYLLNGLVFGFWPWGMGAVQQAGNVFLISVILAAVFQIASSQPEAAGPDTPALLDRLPLEKRGALVSLSVEDHYVRVRTLRGEEMVLMRLSDAIRETAPVEGLRVHRSHWVALDQITAAARRGDGATLSMAQGPEIPVSRANVPALREAGKLPR